MKELVLKYHCFYCEKVKDLLDNNDAAVSISDYSHPGKIYTTILSLAMVMDL